MVEIQNPISQPIAPRRSPRQEGLGTAQIARDIEQITDNTMTTSDDEIVKHFVEDKMNKLRALKLLKLLRKHATEVNTDGTDELDTITSYERNMKPSKKAQMVDFAKKWLDMKIFKIGTPEWVNLYLENEGEVQQGIGKLQKTFILK